MGPEGSSPLCGWFSFGSGFRPGAIPLGTSVVGLVGLCWGLGFGGVFVNWIVDASI